MFYIVGDVNRFRDGEGDVAYNSIADSYEDIISSDVILFWGDFIYSYDFWISALIPRMISHGIAKDFESAIEFLYKYIMLEGADDSVYSKVIIYGTTIVADDSVSLCCGRYFRSMCKLIEKARLVCFRDALSYARFTFLGSPALKLAPDCAMLNSNKYPLGVGGNDRVGVYIGRSEKIEQLKFVFLARSIKKKIKKNVEWIQWFPRKTRDKRLSFLISGSVSGERLKSSEVVKSLYQYDFIITDVYHLAVNAWARGIPVILIGYGARHEKMTLGSKKKEILFSSFFLQDYYVFWESISIFGNSDLVETVDLKLKSHSANKQVSCLIRQAAKDAADCLGKSIFG
ncbi:polysaccharide pyruvyl transferase family protein (plasmid) [Amphritea atlantica]|uniref:Polysaccharide pyruvyl transferase family protein n=1 Tax=Amphritea atlantica TaxID=355243 RepID=A0ABY5H0G0_9GAMM|nr:polysaccharide pyruvyl transferase family protein [Amphritea atlantica]